MSHPNNTSNVSYNKPDKPEPFEILKVIFGSLSILLNGFLLLAMLKKRRTFFAYRVSYLVANLAFADFSTGVILVFIFQLSKLTGKGIHFKHQLELIWAAMIVSFLTLFLMSLERLVVMVLPMTWSNILTTRRTVCGLILIWFISVASVIPMTTHRLHVQFALTITVEFCAVVFIGVHLYIFRFLRTHEHLRRSSEASELSQWASSETSSNLSTVQHSKVTTVVAILMTVLIVTFVPYLVCLQLVTARAIDESFIENLNTDIFDPAFLYTNAFAYLNFVVNPIVYAWRLRMYREALGGLLKSVLG